MYGLLAQIDPAKVVEPSLSVLDKTVIGSLLILSWVLAIALVVQLIRVQNARVADQKILSEKSEVLTTKLNTTFVEMKVALDSLKNSQEGSRQATEALRSAIEALRRSFDLYLISQTQGRKYSPPSGMPKVTPEQIEEELKKREGG